MFLQDNLYMGQEKKTSEEWNKKYKCIMYDHDGWDRKNFDFSYGVEEITEYEFQRRASMSTRKIS